MINLTLSEEEVNTILQGLYYLEDQGWFFEKERMENLIEKLNSVTNPNKLKLETLCDI